MVVTALEQIHRVFLMHYGATVRRELAMRSIGWGEVSVYNEDGECIQKGQSNIRLEYHGQGRFQLHIEPSNPEGK